jgi:hypothetical protein
MATQREIVDEFNALRGEAIQAYAQLESSLSSMFAYLAGVSGQVAGIIFFKMVNARSRIAVLERLKRLKHADAFNLYFNSIMAEAGRLDGQRNKLIHWHRILSITAHEGGLDTSDTFLTAPNFWDFDESSETMTATDIQEFAQRCDIFGRGLNMLTHHWSHPGRGDGTYHDIFEQPLRYPIPEDHLLARKF